ncbi:MAG: endonuclease III [Planctomycetaceae bacterium]|nr:endonuclease III [Planctomycetaceae bacterium]
MAKTKKKIKVDPAEARQRILKFFPILVKTYPDAKTSLDHANPLELLISTILAAQCTDVRVNMVTKDLFKKYHTPQDWLDIPIERLQEEIRGTGFYRNKARSIQGACRTLIEKFNGVVPGTMEELLELDGVGRKTANVVLGNCFGKPAIICDTHMIRLSRRLGLSENADPVKLEFDLMEIVPKTRFGGWTKFSHCIVFHGRAICRAPKPRCPDCPIAKYCPAANKPELW